ncbi:MAG: hypothetical protein KI788_06295 [Mameliella sp.]|nr:hypothetical protein [Mameliella sp.]
MKHLPDYDHDERTRYRLRIEVDCPIEGPCIIWENSLMDLEEVQRAYVRRRNAFGLGASGFSSGQVFDERGQHIARVSYNGRLWRPWPWSTDMEPLAEAPALEVSA